MIYAQPSSDMPTTPGKCYAKTFVPGDMHAHESVEPLYFGEYDESPYVDTYYFRIDTEQLRLILLGSSTDSILQATLYLRSSQVLNRK